jgi:hypothetical protein
MTARIVESGGRASVIRRKGTETEG